MNERLSISGEKTGFANSSSSVNKKYGATNKKPVAAPHLAQPQSFINHKIVSGDTIQGLSLRYAVTPESIKRLNNLFTNDSIHLKTCIKIPVFKDSPATSKSDHSLGQLPLPPSSSFNGADFPPPFGLSHGLLDDSTEFSRGWSPLPPPSSNASPSIGTGVPPISSFDAIIPGLSLPPPKHTSPVSRLKASASTPESMNHLAFPRKPEMSQRALEEGDEDKSISSILGKIDSMLLKSKEDVKEYEKRKTEFSSPNEEEEFSYQSGSAFHYYPHGRSSRSGHQKLRQEGYNDLEGSPELVIKGGAKRKEGKKTSSGASAQRTGKRPNHSGYGELEDEEDVIFEL